MAWCGRCMKCGVLWDWAPPFGDALKFSVENRRDYRRAKLKIMVSPCCRGIMGRIPKALVYHQRETAVLRFVGSDVTIVAVPHPASTS